jgi:hypothetical protein
MDLASSETQMGGNILALPGSAGEPFVQPEELGT